MFRISVCVCAFLVLACFVMPMAAQQPAAASANAAVPSMVNFSGVLTGVNNKPLTGTVGVTFYLYQESQGGSPLWMETQNVQPDKAGHYSVALGSTSSQGLPRQRLCFRRSSLAGRAGSGSGRTAACPVDERSLCSESPRRRDHRRPTGVFFYAGTDFECRREECQCTARNDYRKRHGRFCSSIYRRHHNW